MNENTLLSLITGGKYQTSTDLPPLISGEQVPLRETAHSLMDDLIRKQDEYESEVLIPVREGAKTIFGSPAKDFTRGDLNNLVMGLIGPGQGARLIPSLTKDYTKHKSGRAILDDMINQVKNRREELLEYESIVSNKRNPLIIRAHPSDRKKMWEQDRVDRIKLQLYEKALEQYKVLGAARTGTQDFIPKMLRQLREKGWE